jgi:hypothetical protein
MSHDFTKDEMLKICQNILSRERRVRKSYSLGSQQIFTTIREVRRAA